MSESFSALDEFKDSVIDWTVNYAPSVAGAILVFIIGLCIINCFINFFKKHLKKKKTDQTLSRFCLSLLSWFLKIFLFILVLGTLGVEITTFAAILAGLALAIGFAMQGAFANFAGGVLILVFKPFRIGDLINA